MIQNIKTSNVTLLSSDEDEYLINEHLSHYYKTLKSEQTFDSYFIRDMIQMIKTSNVTFLSSDGR